MKDTAQQKLQAVCNVFDAVYKKFWKKYNATGDGHGG